ncbi:MAG TPA: ABC transporter substrate-binding protein, partial [Bacillota bacterium]|nr:ABC transporter substrate-binding protein [Bacillota bacterium]
MKKRIAKVLTMAMLSSALLTGCGGKTETNQTGNSGANSDVIKIGVLEPMTGANAGGAIWEVNGIKLANKIYPEVLGKKVELVIVDNKTDKVESANAAARLIEKEKVAAIIGSYGSGLCMAAGDAVKNAKIPAVAASATNPQVTLGNDYYFRVCFIDPFQGQVMANYAYTNLKAKKVAIVQEVSNDYSVGLAKFFVDSFTKLTGDKNSIVDVSNYNTGDQDFTAQLTNIKAKNPDVIFAPGDFAAAALMAKQAKQLGIKAAFIGGDTWETPDLLKIGGKDVEGATFSTFFTEEKPLTKESEKFLAEWAKAYPNDKPAAVSALGWDAYILILDAIQKAGVVDSV